MERRVSDNADEALAGPNVTPDGVPQGWDGIAWPELEDDDSAPENELAASRSSSPPGTGFRAKAPIPTSARKSVRRDTNQGPCLYLGPAGQRCSRPAIAGGFCAIHQVGASAIRAIKNPARVLAATAAIVALLWPYIDDLVREILRWANSR